MATGRKMQEEDRKWDNFSNFASKICSMYLTVKSFSWYMMHL